MPWHNAKCNLDVPMLLLVEFDEKMDKSHNMTGNARKTDNISVYMPKPITLPKS